MPRTSSSGSFAGVYAVGLSGAAVSEDANYAGAVMVFAQTSAPTGWTKITTYDDAILKVSINSVTTGGTNGFSTTFTNKTLSGSVSFTSPVATVGTSTVSAPQIQPHTHTFVGGPATLITIKGGPSAIVAVNTSTIGANPLTLPTDGLGISGSPTTSVAHTHPAPGSGTPTTYLTKNMSIKYVDVILASRS